MSKLQPCKTTKRSEEIADEILQRLFDPQIAPFEDHINCEASIATLHNKQICAIINHTYHRQVAGAQFRFWHQEKKVRDFVKNYGMTPARFAKIVSPSLSELFPAKPEASCPSLPIDQNRSSSDDLE